MAISLSDALNITDDKTRPFSIKYVTYNHATQTGGKIIFLPACKRTGASFNLANKDMICVKQDNDDHHYPVHTALILEINNSKVFL